MNRRGFTLVELLVVIAIIALLVSILLPSLANAREQSKMMKCLANIRDQAMACTSYAQEDPSQYIIPLHSRFVAAMGNFSSDADSPGKYVSAAKHSYGGKSGDQDYVEDLAAAGLGSWSGMITGRYSTWNDMGPATRPLNNYLFKQILDRKQATTDELEWRRDEDLDYPVFRCPSDIGFRQAAGGDEGVYMGFGTIYDDPEPAYDNFGSSYANDSILYIGGSPNITSVGTLLKPYTQIPNPTKNTIIKETNGYYGSGWNAVDDPQSAQQFSVGNHGVVRQHTTGFADGHAASIRYEVRTNAQLTSQGVVYNGAYRLRGGDVDNIRAGGILLNPPELYSSPVNVTGIGRFILKGPDWQDHCFPAPAVRLEGATF